MSYDQDREQWAKFLEGTSSSSEEMAMVEQVEADASLRNAVVQDMELDSLLREVYRPQGDSHRFVQNVVTRVASLPSASSRDERRWSEPEKLPLVSTRYPVEPPPRVVTDTQDQSDREGFDVYERALSSETRGGMDSATSPPVTLPTTTVHPRPRAADDDAKSNSNLWRTMVAPLAAVTLIAVVVAGYLEWKRMESNRGPERPTAMSPSGSSMLDGSPADASSLSNGIEPGSSASGNRQGGSVTGALADQDPKSTRSVQPPSDASESMAQSDDVVPGEPSVEEGNRDLVVHGMEGLVAITDVSDEVRWYRRPELRELSEPLSLEQGVVRLEFASGATAVVKSPADFAVASSNRLVLARGHVSAVVPKQAVGFTVDTPSMQIVDLGTRFETDVSSSGSIAVHVLEGKVLLRPVMDTGDVQQTWTLEKGGRKFSDADGVVSDWMVAIHANVFGEMTVSINGEDLPCSSAAEVAAITDHPDVRLMLRSSQDATVRYRFNDQTHLVGDDSKNAADKIFTDLRSLAEIAKRAEDVEGAYRVKNKIYHYGNLQEQLEARRRVARVHGSRALGGQFRPREVFELSAANCDRLDELQRELIMRLAFVEIGAGGRTQVPFEFDSPANRTKASETLSAVDSEEPMELLEDRGSTLAPERDLQAERDQLSRKLDDMLRRVSDELEKR